MSGAALLREDGAAIRLRGLFGSPTPDDREGGGHDHDGRDEHVCNVSDMTTPFRPPSELQDEVIRARNEELEQKAERRAELRGDDDNGQTDRGLLRRMLHRIRGALGGG